MVYVETGIVKSIPDWGEGGKVMRMMLRSGFALCFEAVCVWVVCVQRRKHSQTFRFEEGRRVFVLYVWHSCQRLNSAGALIWRNLCSEGQSKIERDTGKEVVSLIKKTVVGASTFNCDSMPLSVSHLRGEVGGFEVMLEVMLVYPNLNISCPLGTYVCGRR